MKAADHLSISTKMELIFSFLGFTIIPIYFFEMLQLQSEKTSHPGLNLFENLL